jgi:hypothetical protein
MTSPNIFNYATSELSQDAFICWLIEWLNFEEGKSLHDAAKVFVSQLYNARVVKPEDEPRSIIKPENIGKFIDVKTQHYKVDVFFKVKINGKPVNFIIEDKTSTSFHGDQLKDYKKKIKKLYNGDELICIYYKPDYIHSTEREIVEGEGYGVFDYQKIKDFLKDVNTDNVIFNNYRSYVLEKYKKFSQKGVVKISDPECWVYLKYNFFQKDFMESIFEGCHSNKEQKKFTQGRSVGGSPWSQFHFNEVTIDGGTDALFYRLEERKKGIFNLSLRQYSRKKDVKKLNRYNTLSKEINAALLPLHEKSLGKHRKHNKPAYSMTLLNIVLDENKTYENLKSEINDIHTLVVNLIDRINNPVII